MPDARLIALSVVLVSLSGCAHHYSHEAISDPYGFFSGVWHGIVWPFALILNLVSWVLSLVNVSFFSDAQLVGRPNTGAGYYIGFALGLTAHSGTGAAAR